MSMDSSYPQHWQYFDSALQQHFSPHPQVPSPFIHGRASSYGEGIKSSLEAALDVDGVHGSQPYTFSHSSTSPPAQQQFVDQNTICDAGSQDSLKDSNHTLIQRLLLDITECAEMVRDIYDQNPLDIDNLSQCVTDLISLLSDLKFAIGCPSAAQEVPLPLSFLQESRTPYSVAGTSKPSLPGSSISSPTLPSMVTSPSNIQQSQGSNGSVDRPSSSAIRMRRFRGSSSDKIRRR